MCPTRPRPPQRPSTRVPHRTSISSSARSTPAAPARGSPAVVYTDPTANQAVSQYLADLTPRMVAMHSCFHGNGNPVSPGWDYVNGSRHRGQARGEVLACPGDNGFWTAPKIADGWWNSPTHWQSLYGDPRVNAIACGTYGPQNGGRAYQTIACVTYKV